MKLSADIVSLHNKMLNDDARTSRFLAAIGRSVRPGDVAVDVGTGTGILAIAAAKAGARRVYAIESGPIRGVAREMVKANGLSDRVTLVPGYSTEVELPERADVLICEMIGNEPLGERVLEITADAVKRFLKPRARLIPYELKIYGLPVSMPDSARRKLIFTPETLRKWQSAYGIDFAPLGAVNRNTHVPFYLDPHSLRGWRCVSAPALLAEINLKTFGATRVENVTTVVTEKSGQLNGLAVYFELGLSQGECLSTHPRRAGKNNHWLNPVYTFFDPLPVRKGDQLRITYSYKGADKGVWIDVRLLD